MEKSKQLVVENSNAIKSATNSLTALLSEILTLNEKHLATVENNENGIFKTIKDINNSQRDILCVLHKTIIDIEGLLLIGADTCNNSINCDKDIPEIANVNDISNTPAVDERIEPNNVDVDNNFGIDDELELQELEYNENIVESITSNVDTVRKNEETTESSENDREDVNFKLSGRKTSTKSIRSTAKHNTIYCCEIPEKSLPKVDTTCMISHMESPSEFYIHVPDEDAINLDRIGDVICATYSGTACRYAYKYEMMEELARYCVAYVNKYDGWYRVELLDWRLRSKDSDVKVQLIDYGHILYVPYINLRPMIEEVAYYPKLAQRCHLDYICPVGQEKVKREEYKWPTAAIEAFLNILGNLEEQRYNIAFVRTFVDNCNNSFGIDLTRDEDQSSSVSLLLYERGLVTLTLLYDTQEGKVHNSYIMQQVLSAQGELGLPTMSEDEKISLFFQKSLPLERANDINEAIANYSPNDEKRICKFQDKCRKKNCKFEHVRLTQSFTTDRLPIFMRTFYELELPKGGDTITLNITHIKTVCNFFIHLNPFDSNEVYSQFNRMLNTMNQPGTIKTYKPYKILPALGEIVIVYWEERWYRAKVRDIRALDDYDSVNLQVFIVDYGPVVDVSLSDIREIEEDFMQVPFQAVECRLFNASVKENMDVEEAKEYLEFTLNGHCTAQVISANVGYLELLVSIAGGEDLGEKLICEGFAVPRSANCVPKESEMYLVD